MANFLGRFFGKGRNVNRKIEDFLKNLSINRINSLKELPEIDIEKPFNAYITLAILLREKGEFHKCIKLLENLLKESLEDDDEKLVMLNLAITYRVAGFVDRAEAVLKEGIEKFPAEGYFYYELARVNQLYDNWEEAVKNLEIAQGLNGEFQEELFYTKLFFINRLIDNEEIDKAFVVVKTLNDIFLVPFFYYTLARIYFAIGDDERAMKNLEIGIRLSEKHADSFLKLLKKYRNFNIEELEVLIKRVGLVYSLSVEYAKLLEVEGREEEALEIINKVAEKFPLKAEVKELQLRLMWNLGKRKQAVDVILSSLERLKKERKRYVCEACGYKTNSFEWCCPKCKTWESLKLDIE
ncbi:hypothetical protein [Desulfurobacterium atlanticum]|uniref:Lipopolysaccharide biosynthesis regulator YciM, contains six TPR domains and a predicted metal-binding C-terminal domain n=1 Tax=Desulfurobacterium atlanticum TaxID=240169 RepID=A0A238Y172_9BACT|nr:hypothetical protein [Desulfurobacterium atlanticum]SNR64722.1 Lipopolysaccharide biosynthesis regulator YciM, contains six TPR domains and a predicted metal-binding C-terminal domain [Desulfurobacterium atlanticum]